MPDLADQRQHAARARPGVRDAGGRADAARASRPSSTPRSYGLGGPPDASGARRRHARASADTDPRRPCMSADPSPAPAARSREAQAFVFRAVEEVGATLNAALVVMGDKLGLYRAMAGAGGRSTPAELAGATGVSGALRPRVAERPGRRRLRRVRPRQRPLHAPARAGARADRRPTAPRTCPGFFQIALGAVIDSPRITEAARTGDGRRLARAHPRRLRGLRAVLPPRLQREPRRGPGCPRSTA